MSQVITASEAVSLAVRLARVEVVAVSRGAARAGILEDLCEPGSEREAGPRVVGVESDASVMAACMGASSTGARAFTATSPQGLAAMQGLLPQAAGARLPIVMAVLHGAAAPGWTPPGEANRGLSQRDGGWIQVHCERIQELLDSTIQAFRLAEAVSLPVLVTLDALRPAHEREPVDVPLQEEVDAFLPGRAAPRPDGSVPRAAEDAASQSAAMAEALGALEAIDQEWGRRFGRRYGAIERHQTGDADVVLVACGPESTAARRVVDPLREQGGKVGLVRLRLLRPFPTTALRDALSGVPRVTVLDRDLSPGRSGVLAEEVRAALYDLEPGRRPAIHDCVAGLDGPGAILDCVERTRAAQRAGAQP